MSLLPWLLLISALSSNPCEDFDRFDKQIRDGTMERNAARTVFSALIPRLNEYAAQNCVHQKQDTSGWISPVDRTRLVDVGGKSGSGYKPGGYNYFDGNRHHGHPAQDIFIPDRNRDERDDRSRQLVGVRSVVAGIVVALESDWEVGSALRGGRYTVIYQPSSGELFCYAHLRSVLVRVGQCVVQGELIGEVGRSGKSAARRRSPTHLHFTRLRIVNGLPYPVDSFPDLKQAIRKRRSP